MTDVNEKTEVKDNENSTTLSKRLHRRSLLKAGAIAAPLAMTLHSGAAATALGNHASSAGLCVLDLREIATNPSHPRNEYMQIPMKNGRIARRRDRRRHNGRIQARDCEKGTRLEPFDPRNRVHWDFIKDPRNGRFGMSCINSIQYGKYSRNCNNGFGNGDQCAPGNSFFNNKAENDGNDNQPGHNGNINIPN